MRTLLLAIAVAPLLAAVPALGASDLDKLKNKAARYAVTNVLDDPARALCVCDDGSASNDDRLGVLQALTVGSGGFNRIQVTCYVIGFDQVTGDAVTAVSCDPWIPLTR